MTRGGVARLAAGAALAAAALTAGPGLAAGARHPVCPSHDWPQYGHDAAHGFAVAPGCTAISPSTAPLLVQRWYLHTPDSVTASPTVVGGTVYVGSWDGTFYAIDARTGKVRWTFAIRAHTRLAFGRIVSSAAVLPFPDAARGGRPRLVVLFGGGSALWALDAATGRELAALDLDPRDAATRARQRGDPPVVEVESSPAVADVGVGGHSERRIYVGLDLHDDAGVGRTGVVALRLDSDRSGRWQLVPLWKNDAETGATYRGPGLLTRGSGSGAGCGGVWSSPAVDAADDLVVYGTANCDHPEQARAGGLNYAESMIAVRADTGAMVWRFRPADHERGAAAQLAAAHRDDDFGASPNVFRTASGRLLVGEGAKSAMYYARDPQTGAAVWTTDAGTAGHVSDGFAIGGFIGGTAVDPAPDGSARRIIGATAFPIPHSLDDVRQATWFVRSLDARTGAVQWVYALGGPTYAATTVANGVAFVPDTVGDVVIGLDTSDGRPVWVSPPMLGPPSSAAAVAGDSVYVGAGTRETDLEFKAIGDTAQRLFAGALGASPLSPLSGVYCYRLLGH